MNEEYIKKLIELANEVKVKADSCFSGETLQNYQAHLWAEINYLVGYIKSLENKKYENNSL